LWSAERLATKVETQTDVPNKSETNKKKSNDNTIQKVDVIRRKEEILPGNSRSKQ
jgi:hypothetical protein